MDNGGVKTHVVNNKAQISHEIEKKTTLDKKRGGALEKRQTRTVGNNANTTRGSPAAIHFAMGGGMSAGKKPQIPKAAVGAKKAVEIGKKPLSVVKGEFYKKADKSDDNGVKSVKLGLQIKDYGTSGLKTAVNTGIKTAKNGSKLAKRVYRRIHKPTSAELRRKLRKRVNHNLAAEAKFLAKRAVKNASKAVGKAAANAAKQAAKAAYKAAQAMAKAVAQAAAKVVSLIVETMPWSLIIIGAVLLIVLVALMFGSMLSGAAGSVAGGGAWLVNNNSTQTPEEIYEGYKEFVEQAKDVMESQAKDALKSTVSDFCDNDTDDPRRIIEYHDDFNTRTIYPAAGADVTINALIDQFGTDDYADYMSLLFVLMTREKQQADGVSDDEIYDFDFVKEDFEEFMKSVNENSCRFGDTFVIKTAVETTSNACPSNCQRETRSDCDCCSSTDPETGEETFYCGGHCPVDHTKMTVTLYTVKGCYGKDYPEIYNFTDNEKTRYEASKAIIQGLLDYWEENE